MNPEEIGDQVTTFVNGLAVWAADALPNLAAALLLLLLGIWFSGRVARGIGRLLKRTRVDETLHHILTTVVRYTILVVVFIAVLGQLGIQTTSILAALGALGLAVGLALQGTLTNIAAGIMILWLKPFRSGDYIDAEGISGTVKQVGLFTSAMVTWDGLFQFVPNSQRWNKRVINYARLPTRLVNLTFGIAYGDDIALGKETLLNLAKADERALKQPEPYIFVGNLGDSAVELTLRVWASTADYWGLRRALTEQGKVALEEAGLSIPFPQRDVHHYGMAAPEGPGGDPGERSGPSDASVAATAARQGGAVS